MVRKRFNISLNKKIVDEAKDVGINLSKFCENALKKAVKLHKLQTKPLEYKFHSPRIRGLGKKRWRYWGLYITGVAYIYGHQEPEDVINTISHETIHYTIDKLEGDRCSILFDEIEIA